MNDSSESVISVASVLPKDAISSIDDPTLGEEHFGDPDDEVLIVDPDTVTSPARVYPIRILN